MEDSSWIQKIMDLRENETKDRWGEIADAERKSIEQGIADADNGKMKSNAEAKKIYGKWL